MTFESPSLKTVREEVFFILEKVLGDMEGVTDDSRLNDEIDFESIDRLDLVFRAQEKFGLEKVEFVADETVIQFSERVRLLLIEQKILVEIRKALNLSNKVIIDSHATSKSVEITIQLEDVL